MQSIKSLKSLKGKTVLVRADFNVPIENAQVVDTFRIKKAIPTLELLQKKGARIIIISHIGSDGKESLEAVSKVLNKLIKVTFIPKVVLSKEEISKLSPTGIYLLENLRKEKGEKENDKSFAKQLAAMADLYVNEAFSDSHRAHASIVGIPKLLPHYAGLQFEQEVKNLETVLQNPKHPFLFMLGGAKFDTKLPLITKFLKTADSVFIAGALANNFLKTAGYEVGKSYIEDKNFGLEKLLKNKKLLLPVDVTVISDQDQKTKVVKSIMTVLPDETILDIGNETTKMLAPIIADAKLVLWNGPTGKYEAGFDKQTIAILKLLAKACEAGKTKVIIGGGDTVALVSKLKLENKFTFVSTGGGATLEFLAKGTLAGLKALE